MRKLIAISALGSVALGLLSAGCGGGGGADAQQIDQRAFVNRANKICEQTTGRLAAEVGSMSTKASSEPGYDYTKAQIVIVKEALIPRLEEELKAIRALGVPDEVKQEAEAFLAASQRVIVWVKANPKPLVEGHSPPYEAAEVAGAKFGVTECPFTILKSS